MNRISCLFATALLVFVFGPYGALDGILLAEELQLVADRDTTLYEGTGEQFGNGGGEFLYAGRTGRTTNGTRRSLLHFDLSSIPSSALITAATLTMEVTKASTEQATNHSLHRVLADWDEGATKAGEVSGEGQGAPAGEEEATWLNASNPTTAWSTAGGDFFPAASASVSITFDKSYTWGDDGGLIDDVQLWVNEPETNFGWMLIGDESTERTSRRFNSRTNPDEVSRPTLNLEFEVAESIPFDCDGNGLFEFSDLDCTCQQTPEQLNEARLALSVVLGDIDGDGEVAFLDFLILVTNFGQMATYSEGDLDCDGEVRFNDFLSLAANFGRSSGELASVPEPSGQLMLGLSLGMAALVNRKKRCAS